MSVEWSLIAGIACVRFKETGARAGRTLSLKPRVGATHPCEIVV